MADSTHPGHSRRNPRGKAKPVQVLGYRHDETRVNNPDVGMVHAGTDPDGHKTTWTHDPHLDPVLNFDSVRAGIETLIDDAHMAERFSDHGLSLALAWDPAPDSTLGHSLCLGQTMGGPATAQVETLERHPHSGIQQQQRRARQRHGQPAAGVALGLRIGRLP